MRFVFLIGSLFLLLTGAAPSQLRAQETRPKEKEPAKALSGDPQLPEAIKRLATLQLRHKEQVICLRFSPDGKLLATGGDDRIVRLWDMTCGKELRILSPHPGPVSTLVFSPNGHMLASASGWFGKAVHLSQVATGQELAQLGGPEPKLAQPLEEVIKQIAGEEIRSIAFSPDGKALAGRNRLGCIRIWEIATGKEVRKFQDLPGMLCFVIFSPDGKTLLSGTDGSRMRIFDPGSADERKWPVDCPATSIAFAPDGDSVALGYLYNKTILLRDIRGRAKYEWAAHEGGVNFLAFSPDGRILISQGADIFSQGNTRHSKGMLRLWEVATAEQLGQFSFKNGLALCNAAFSPDGRMLALASEQDVFLIPFDNLILEGKPLLPRHLSIRELENLWDELAADSALKARRAICKLAYAKSESVSFLSKQMKPDALDTRRLERLMEDLDSSDFAVREKAQTELEVLDLLAAPTLERALGNKPSLEKRRRIEQLLEKIRRAVAFPSQKQILRAIETLEKIGTPDAQRVLARLAGGTPASRQTVEAKASLKRLQDHRK